MQVQNRKFHSLKENLWNITGFPVLSYIIVNALLLLYDLRNPGVLLIGDRAGSRFNKIGFIIDRIQSGTSLKEIIISNGDPFDYLYHLLPYYFFGEIGVTVCQIALYTIGIIFFSKLCNLLFSNKKITTIAVFLYAFLPSSIFTPHVLVTEAFFNPFVIIYTYYIVKYIHGYLYKDLLTASIFATLAIATRQVFLLFPPLILLVAFVFKKKLRLHLAIIALVVTLLLPAACLSYFYLDTGRLSYGKSNHSLSFNLYSRVSRMSELEKISLSKKQHTKQEISIIEFIGYVMDYPLLYGKTVKSDIANLLFNSGVNTLFCRYLDIVPIPAQRSYWIHIRDQYGLIKTVRHMAKYYPRLFILNVASFIPWMTILLLSLAGSGQFLLSRNHSIAIKIILLGELLYIVFLSNLANSVRWGHRGPIDFIISLFCIYAIRNTYQWMHNRSKPRSRIDSH